jgi:hypothetical protein
VKYAVTVTSTGGPMTEVIVEDLRRLGGTVVLAAEPSGCDVTFTIEAADAQAATALAIEGVRAARGEVTVDGVSVSVTDATT